MKGILIYNRFLNSGKFTDIYDRLRKVASEYDIQLDAVSNADILSELFCGPQIPQSCPIHTAESTASLLDSCDFILFWDKDVILARALEASGYRLFNSADAIAVCDDKALTYERLNGIVRMPRTIHIPMTFSGIGYTDCSFIDMIGDILGYPFVIKECSGSFGAQVYLAQTPADAKEILAKTDGHPCIAQEYIAPQYTNMSKRHVCEGISASDSHFGSDIRIQTVGNNVVAAMHRYNMNDFRANITNGGSMEPYNVTDKDREIALKTVESLHLDFAGVDIMHDREGEPVLLEVNSNAHFKNIYDCTGVNVAEKIIEHIYRNVRR